MIREEFLRIHHQGFLDYNEVVIAAEDKPCP